MVGEGEKDHNEAGNVSVMVVSFNNGKTIMSYTQQKYIIIVVSTQWQFGNWKSRQNEKIQIKWIGSD